MTNWPTNQRGFTLFELAVSLTIIGILLGGLLMPLSAQLDQRATSDTQTTLQQARDALLGFAIANGRLPCPATGAPNTTGIEAPEGGGPCTQDLAGFLPGVTLGLTPLDAQGYVLDGWGNRIRYAVTPYRTSLFTTSDGVKTNWPLPESRTLLTVCTTSTGILRAGAADADCPTEKKLANNTIAVLFSVGKNKSANPGADEAHNLNSDRVFVSHEPTAANNSNGEFDDIMIWLSEPVLYNRLIAAGRLP